MTLLTLAVQIPTPPPTPEFPIVVTQGFQRPPWETMPPMVFAIIIIAITAGAVAVLWPLMRALARRLEGRTHDPELRAEIEELRMRLHELEGQQLRVAELEERVDFAERLLTQGRVEVPRMPGGGT